MHICKNEFNMTPAGYQPGKRSESRRLIYNACINEDSVCAEVGVWRGDNAQLMHSFHPKHLYLIDCWQNQSEDPIYSLEKGNLPQETFDSAYQLVLDSFKNYNNVSIVRDFSNNAVRNFEDEFFDMIYIDALLQCSN